MHVSAPVALEKLTPAVQGEHCASESSAHSVDAYSPAGHWWQAVQLPEPRAVSNVAPSVHGLSFCVTCSTPSVTLPGDGV